MSTLEDREFWRWFFDEVRKFAPVAGLKQFVDEQAEIVDLKTTKRVLLPIDLIRNRTDEALALARNELGEYEIGSR